MSISSKIQLEEAENASGNAGSNLPSLKKTLLKPRNLLIILIISIVLNIILLIAALLAATANNTASVTPVPTKVVSTTPTITPKPTVQPSRTPDETINSLIDCFNNCDVDELLNRSRTVALEITNFKVSSSYISYKDRNCYGNYLESSSPDMEYNTYSTDICENNYISKPPSDSIQVGDNLYVLNSSGNWNLESKPRIGQSRLIRVLDDAIAQQDRKIEESPKGSRFKQISASSKTINELNQQVTKHVLITFNNQLEVMDYRIEVENVSIDEGYFFALREQNDIKAPL